MALTQLLTASLLVVMQGLAAAQPAPSAPAPAASAVLAEPLADTIRDRAADALFWGDWDALEQLYAAARQDPQRSAEGGLAACQFGNGVNRRYENESLAYREAVVAATLDWARRRPESPLAHALHLDALVDLAWFHRGSGYAKTVSDQRFEDFRAKLSEAMAYTKANAAVMSRDNYYVRPLLTLLRGMNVGVDKQLDIARKSLRREPADDCLYFQTIDSLVPKWGGDPRDLESWIRESMKGLPEPEALMRYARLYNSATESDFEQGLFENSLARWPLMRDGLRQLVSTLPKSRFWKNRLAYFACMVKDRDVAVPALEAIETEPKYDAWGSTGQRSYQACKRWALQS